MTLILIIAALLIGLIEGLQLIKKKMWKELMTVGFILSIAMFLQISKDLGMITPINLLEKLFEPIGKIFLNKL